MRFLHNSICVVPDKSESRLFKHFWTPAFAGVTKLGSSARASGAEKISPLSRGHHPSPGIPAISRGEHLSAFVRGTIPR